VLEEAGERGDVVGIGDVPLVEFDNERFEFRSDFGNGLPIRGIRA